MSKARPSVPRRRVGSLIAALAVGSLAAGLTAAPSASAAVTYVSDPASYVNTLAGTASGGSSVGSINNFPGAAAPFGMMQFSPDIPGNGAGYYYNSGTSDLKGFSLNHASQGCGAFGDVPILPTTVDPTTGTPWTKLNTFDHSDEEGQPGYYRLTSKDNAGKSITTELTATTRSGIAEFTFPAGTTPAVTFRTGVSNGTTVKGAVNVNPTNGTVTGWTVNSKFCGQNNQYRVYFTAKFEQAFTQYGAWNESTSTITNKTVGTDTTDAEVANVAKPGGYVRFAPTTGATTIRMKISMSYVKTGDLVLGQTDPTSSNHGGSSLNLATEIPTNDYKAGTTTPFSGYEDAFDSIRAQTKAQWNSELSKIKIAASASERDIKTFYHSLYRSYLHPNVFEDVDGKYVGFEKFQFLAPGATGSETLPTVHDLAASNEQYGLSQEHVYANFSDWDTYRSWAPLISTLAPKVASDIAQTYVLDADQSGQFPRWAMANSSTDQMSGDNASAQISQFHAFGASDFDTSKALYYMHETALGDTAGTYTGGQNTDQINRPAASDYSARKYAAQLPEHQTDHAVTGASVTQEWSIDDFAISQFASSLTSQEVAAADVPANVADLFAERTNYWQNLFNPLTMCLSPRDYDGRFPVGSNCNSTPTDFGYRGKVTGFGQVGFDEASSEQYLWMTPQNIQGLITTLGGREAAAERLDEFMTGGYNVGANDPRMWIGNEPSFATPWVYNYLGRPWRTQEVVEQIRTTLFGYQPSGAEPGNDDLGAQSSWYVWAALGVYPATPGTDTLTVNSPTFEHAQIELGNGKTLTINAPGATSKRYVGGLSVNGVAQSSTALSDGWRTQDTTLDFTMSSSATTWGTGTDDAPPSYDTGSNPVVGYADPVTATPGSTANAQFAVQRIGSEAASYRLNTTGAPAGLAVKLTGDGAFDSTGHATDTVAITVGSSVKDGDYLIPVTVVTSDGETQASTLTVRVAASGGFLAATSIQAISKQAANHVAFDGYNGFVRNLVDTAGIAQGSSADLGAVSGNSALNGLKVTLAKTSEGLADTVVPNGQTIALTGNPTKISFVGASKSGNTAGSATVTLDNGTTATADLSLGDWVLPSSSGDKNTGTLTPYSTNVKVLWTAVRFGQSADPGAYVFSTAPYTAPSGRTITSVTLTGSASDNRRVFAIAQNTASTTLPAAPTQALGAATVAAGSTVSVTGTGFQPAESVRVVLGQQLLTTVTADGSGAVHATITVPKTTKAGNYQVQLQGASSGSAAASTLAVTAATWDVTLSAPASVTTGTQVQFTGTGFAPSEEVTVTLGSSSQTVYASTAGNLTGSIAAPASAGTYSLAVAGKTSGATASRSLSVTVIPPSQNAVSLSATPSLTVFGKAVALTGQVAAGTTGQVEFFDGSKSLGKATISGTRATLTTSTLAVGAHAITAKRIGSSSVSTVVYVSVVKAGPSTVKVTAKKYTRKKTAKVTATVGKLTNGQYPVGKVTVYVGKKKAKTVALAKAAKGTVTVKLTKKYTKKKSLKIKAVFTPSDSSNVLGKTSATKTVKAKK